jgi:hypothetical protein
MKFLLTAAMLLLPSEALARPADSDDAAVMAPVQALFAAFNARSGPGVLAQTWPEGLLMDVHELSDGSREIYTTGWAKLAAVLKPGPDKNEERLAKPAIKIDGDIAMVWAPYVTYVNGKADHCGVDLMDVVREKGVWKVLNVTSSHRNTDCMPR